MYCPNCGERPVGIFSSYRLNGVGLKKALTGHFKCRHCRKLLKQVRSPDHLFPSYRKPFWYFYALFIVMMIGVIWIAFSVLSAFASWIQYLVLVTGLILCVWQMDEIKIRYWIIREVEEESTEPDRKLTAAGWVIFTAFMLVAIALFKVIPAYVDLSQMNEWYYTIGMIVYLLVIIMGANFIFKRFSFLETDTGKEKSSQKSQ